MRFAITGSTGLIGSELTRTLRAQGHEITRVTRSYSDLPHGERAVIWHPDQGVIEGAGLEEHDVVIHLAGESLAGLWTARKKQRIRTSREKGTLLLAQTLAALSRKPHALFSASAFGIYGDRPTADTVDESSATGAGFLPEVARAWEAATRPAQEAGIRVVNMRFGNVLSAEGGMLGALAPLYKLGLGPTFGDGKQVWPWIAAADITPALLHVLERPEIAGPVNFVAPDPVTNEAFTHALAAALGRPSFLKLPTFAVRLAPGGMGEAMLLAGARVVPRKLLDTGYAFRLPELQMALRAIMRETHKQ